MAQELKIPVLAGAQPQATQEAALWSVEQESMCPACKRPMSRANVAGVPAFVCLEDRTVLPAKQLDVVTTNKGA